MSSVSPPPPICGGRISRASNDDSGVEVEQVEVELVENFMAGDPAGDMDGDGTTNLEEFSSPLPPGSTFDDVPEEHCAFTLVETLGISGITGGCGGENCCPNDPVTRAQMAVVLV